MPYNAYEPARRQHCWTEAVRNLFPGRILDLRALKAVLEHVLCVSKYNDHHNHNHYHVMNASMLSIDSLVLWKITRSRFRRNDILRMEELNVVYDTLLVLVDMAEEAMCSGTKYNIIHILVTRIGMARSQLHHAFSIAKNNHLRVSMDLWWFVGLLTCVPCLSFWSRRVSQ